MPGTSRYRNRWDLAHAEPHRLSLGDFACRLEALYGPPQERTIEGFVYAFTDRETGVVFTAYSAGSGPAYGAHLPAADAGALRDAVDAFDTLIEATRPVDCTIEHASDAGPVRSGVEDGSWFVVPAP